MSSTLKPWPFIYCRFFFGMKSGPVTCGLYIKPIFSDSYEPSSSCHGSCHVKVFVAVAVCFLVGFTWNGGGEPNSAYQWLKEISDKTGSGHWVVIFWGWENGGNTPIKPNMTLENHHFQ